MMVTFVSQCEKKALPRTRRVLDAFANRIGDNTWQTVITKEGLEAVQKLLRKTASKSTAVSCHWIRSRSRSDLLWVVGNKKQFGFGGVVPVNRTDVGDIKKDEPRIMNEEIYANTQKQPLVQHLFAVGYIAYQLLDGLNVQLPKLKQAAFLAGIFHDIGKVDPQFQQWICKKSKKPPIDEVPEDGVHIESPKKFSFENHPRHHELSWLLTQSLLDDSALNTVQLGQILHGIYWHHTKPFRKEPDEKKFIKAEGIYAVFNKSLDGYRFSDIYQAAGSLMGEVNDLAEVYGIDRFMPKNIKNFSLDGMASLPDYKIYNEWSDELKEFKDCVRINALNNLIRTAVISADRLVSSLDATKLSKHVECQTLQLLIESTKNENSDLRSSIGACINGFESRHPNSDRNLVQKKAAQELADLQKIAKINESANIAVLQGPAGCGKTKIALEWAQKTNAERIIWVCPRVQICLGLLHDLKQDEYLADSNIEIFTGEYKRIVRKGGSFDDTPETDESDYFSGDIVLTTIDQAVNAAITHHRVTAMVDLMQAHVVFDEFHELINMPAFNLLFAELIEIKRLQGDQANTLLVSATPHYYFVEKFLEINDKDIVSIKSFNQSKYSIDFQRYNEQEEVNPLLVKPQKDRTFVITNTAQDAQAGFLLNLSVENNVLLHSKFTKQDRSIWFDKVFDCFKQNGNNDYDVLRSGPIVQASLNISCDNMLTELTCAENWLQRLGRLDRFGQNVSPNHYVTVIPESADKGMQTSSTARFLNQLCVWQSTMAWLTFLQDKLSDNSEVTLNALYQIYHQFYKDRTAQISIEEDVLKALKESVSLINNKIVDPISVMSKTKKLQSIMKISRSSLRGDNRFVQLAVCNVSDDLNFTVSNKYVSPETVQADQPITHLTESVQAMCGYGDDNNNLVQYMRKKHHNIKKADGYKQARNEGELIKEARSPESPIYLSYTPNDLEAVGGEGKAHSAAIYYGVCNKQPIGAISLRKLQEKLHLKTTN